LEKEEEILDTHFRGKDSLLEQYPSPTVFMPVST